MTIIGILQIYLSINETIKQKKLDNTYLQLSGGLLLLIPGLYQTFQYMMAWLEYDGYSYDLRQKIYT